MGRYDNIMRFAEIRKFLQEKQYKKAIGIVEKIDTDKIKAVTELNLLADVYLKNEKYQEAKELLYRIYEKSATRRILYQLICLDLKTGTIQEAEKLYEEYQELDKSSSDRIILKYCIAKAKGIARAELIPYLETLKKEDYQEEWAYELAKLYHKQGMEAECVRECSDIILWFGEGLIVEKAKLLKLHYVEGLDIMTPPKKAENIVHSKADQLDSKVPDVVVQEKETKENTKENTTDEREAKEIEIKEIETEEIETVLVDTLQSISQEPEAEGTSVEAEASEEPEAEGTSVEAEASEEPEAEGTSVEAEASEEPEAEGTSVEAEASEEPEAEGTDVEAEVGEEPEADTTLQVESQLEEVEETLVEKVIREVFEQVDVTTGPIHFVLVEERQVHLTQTVKGLARELCTREILPTAQIAKITAEKLNGISLKEKGERLKNGCLLIEQAGDLTTESVQGLINFMKENEDAIVVILEDNEDAIHWLFKKNKKLKQWFLYNIYLPME